jgi:hypothetical protein
MDNRTEPRRNTGILLEVLHGKKQYTVQTKNISSGGLAIESSVRLKPTQGQLLHFVQKIHQQRIFFSAMVKWYQSQLHRNLVGLQIVNPPTTWFDKREHALSNLIFQLHFGNILSLKEEYRTHLTHGFLEVSPTPQVPSLNTPVTVDVFLPGLEQPERVEGIVLGHTPGGFRMGFPKSTPLLKRVRTLCSTT